MHIYCKYIVKSSHPSIEIKAVFSAVNIGIGSMIIGNNFSFLNLKNVNMCTIFVLY